MIKVKNYTYKEIEEEFDVALGTARNWVTLPGIEMIPGSWPYTFRWVGSNGLEKVSEPGPTVPQGNVVVLPDIPQEDVETFFRKIMNDESPHFEFNERFRLVDGTESLIVLEKSVISCLIVIRYYKELLKNEGL
jgi:hypothetical protein